MNNAKIYLCKADSGLLGSITGILPDTCNLTKNVMDLWELTFDVNRYTDADGILVQSDYYDSIDEMMRLYLDTNDTQIFFVIDSEPLVKGDGYQEVKSVTAHSIECELCNIYLKNLKINCGTSDSQEYLACDTDENGSQNYYNVNPYTGLPYEYISLVNYNDPQLSLLHLALQGTGWSVKEGLDNDICSIKKSFQTSDSVYSFLMKTVSPAASVIFEFDRKNKQVGIVKADNYGEDTGVFITMRNLMNSFEVTSTSNDSIITKLTPTGADNLGIEYVNFGQDYITNLDYFMNTLNEYGDYKFVSSELHDKYNAWKDYREKEQISIGFEFDDDTEIIAKGTRREVYTELTKLYNKTISDISELRNRLPNDGCLIDYRTYKLDELKTAYTAYNKALLALITLYKNEYGVTEIDYTSENLTPTPSTATNIKDTPYWYDFYAYKDKIIPAVKEALKMYCETDDNGNLKINPIDGSFIELENGNPDYYKDYNILKEVNSYLYEWSLYGLDELESKKKAWLEAANLLFDECFIFSENSSSSASGKPPITYRTPDETSNTGWKSLSDEQKSRFTTFSAYSNKLNQYLDYMSFNERKNSLTNTTCTGIIRQCEKAIDERTAEISAIEQKQKSYNEERKKLADSVALNEDFRHNSNTSDNGTLINDTDAFFTKTDIDIINSLIKEQNFNNENILITSLDDIVSTVNVQEELYQSAASKLYEISQPQYSFRTELDNLYSLEEFKAYQKPFDIGNFIRVGLEIHEELYDNNFIKLRLISISYNPLEISESLSVEFSTMTKSLNSISDLTFLLGSEYSSGGSTSSSGGSSGSSSGSTYGNNDANVQISNNMLNALLSTEMFGTAVNDVLLDTIQANKGNFNTLLANSGVFGSLEDGSTIINGECISTGNIKSNNFISPTATKNGTGTCFNLDDGTFESYTTQGNYIINDGNNLKIKMSNFQIDEDGNANFKGDITGSNGVIDGVFTGEVTGEVTGSLNIIPGLRIPNNYFLEICFEYTDRGGVTFNLEIEYYHVANVGLELTTKTYYDFYYSPVAPDGGDGNLVSIKRKISASEINGNEIIWINNIDIICSDNRTACPEIISVNIIDDNNKTVKSYNNNIFTNNSNKLYINTALGLINGDKLSINADTGVINGGTYTGSCIGTININNNFIVENNGTTNCSDLNIIGGRFTHQIKRNQLPENNDSAQIEESIWKDQAGNEYCRNILMDNYGLSIETNRSDGLSFESSELLFKDRQFSLYNDDDGEISLCFSGYCGDEIPIIGIDNIQRASLEIIEFPINKYDIHMKNRIDINGMHGESRYYQLVYGGTTDPSLVAGDGLIKQYRADTTWHYGDHILCVGAYEQVSFSGLSKRTLYVGSDGTISAASSSRRYKQDISSNLDDYFDPHPIYDLPVCQFRYNAENGGGDDSQLYIGFIAEDVAKYYPPAARWNKNHTEVDTWEMSDMFPAAIKLIQEQHDEIETLKENLEILKEEISSIKNILNK